MRGETSLTLALLLLAPPEPYTQPSQTVTMPSALARRFLLMAAGLLLAAGAAWGQDGRALWTDLGPGHATHGAHALADEPAGVPSAYRALAVDPGGLADHLARAPRERAPGDLSDGVLLALPLPDGRFATYRVAESSVMAPALQARYPGIRTYVGVGVDEPGATVRLSVTPHGVHAVGARREGTLVLDPASRRERGRVRAYWRHDARPPAVSARHRADHVVVDDYGVAEELAKALSDRVPAPAAPVGVLRVYRAAFAATGEYTRFHSADSTAPSVAEGLAAIVTTLHRVNGIYERDLGIRLVLVERNDAVVYTDPRTDPYTNSSGSMMLGQNQTNLDAVIGAQHYDVGHVFSTGGGGLANLGVVCRGGSKARGVTGLESPAGDLFDVDYVAHELGHQFGANHTFNGFAGLCGAHRNHVTAVEPGSGSTIMAYAGICGAHNLQTRSDDYFHTRSIAEINAYLATSTGSSCGERVSTGRAAPGVTVRDGIAIPVGTPFVLRAEPSASDAALSFTWEGLDRSDPSAPPMVEGWDDTAPFFRSFRPSPSPVRVFPRPDLLVLGLPTLGEGLPTSERTLRFRLTVRDNVPGAGSIADVEVRVPVVSGAGPFRVTSQASEGVAWEAGSDVVVTWSVANTAQAAFGGERVDVLLSLDREHGFAGGTALVLAAAVPNNGAASVRVPEGVTTTRGRVFVRASEGLFFAVSAHDITVAPRTASGPAERPRPEPALSAAYPNPVRGAPATLHLTLPEGEGRTVRVALYDALGREAAVVHDGPVPGGAPHPFLVETAGLAAGVYYVRVTGGGLALVRPLTVAR